MAYLFHFSQNSAEIADFGIFLGKKEEISDISKNRANSNISAIALDSVDMNYKAEVKICHTCFISVKN